MKVFYFFFFSLLLLLPDYVLSSSRRPVEKPSPPVTVSITSSGEIFPGAVLGLTVRAGTMTDADEMTVDIKLPPRVELISGELSWRGPVKSGDIISLPISIRVPEKGKGRVSVRAIIDPPGPTRFSASDSLKFGPEKAKDRPAPAMKRDGRGRKILEYRP